MRKSLLFGALLSCTFGPVCTPTRAQNAPVATAPNSDRKSGYDLFLEARKLLKAGPNGEPSAAEELAPAENLRRQRLAVARNAPALAKLRAALKASIALPLQDTDNFRVNASAREFARQLAQEAAVRAADGDNLGAAQSGLDAIELGAQTSSGATIQWLTGNAIASLGYARLRQYAPRLDAAQTRAVIARLALIQLEEPTIESVLRSEEKISFELGRPFVEDAKERARMKAELLEPEDKKVTFTREETRAILALTPAQFEANVRAVFAEATARAGQPYQTVARLDDLKGADPLTDLLAPATRGYGRIPYDRRTLSDQFVIAALRLRLIELETGQYPQTFDAGADPFSPDLSPLKYKRAGDSYVLYSVGPDGKDDDGAKIQTVVTNNKTGVKSVDTRVDLDSTGDIVAPVL